ncbi:hypothetical protein STCU_08871 [Strigomonas culicis]|uniref:Uncharacterized protein n=1 Tax=Strigomonas culicis TaxID=28005 RepID=S9TQT3_9TRYP|nr:hypothetical protein STCU_08871 [Strigomonas culicis]|eukprot:EPY20707.1 hypothetical protein STCU_08871 [Strigomonas culicis]
MRGCRLLRSPPTARAATLLSPYGAALHGYHRGPQAAFAEPMDVWLTVLSQAVPFYKDVLILCPSHYSPRQVQRLWRRARQHLPEAHVASVPPPRATAASVAAAAATAAPATPTAGALLPHSAAEAPDGLALRPPATANPFQRFPAHTFDVLVFAANAFSEPHMGGGARAPFYISEAHRVLRPHGVLAVTGSTVPAHCLHVAAPRYADHQFVQQYLRALQQDRLEVLQRLGAALDDAAAAEGKQAPDRSADVARLRGLAAELTAAVSREESIASGHADLYFPFRGVQRRWLTSEFELTAAQLAEALRGMPLYQQHRHALAAAHELLHRRGGRDAAAAAGPPSDFVELPLPGGGAAGAEALPVLGVRREVTPVDPLELLHDALRELLQLGISADDRVRVQVQDFVLTCSNRSMNTGGDAQDLYRLSGRRRA